MLYTSELTNKSYKTVEELEAAEAKWNEAHAAEIKAKEERQADVAEIKELAKTYLKLCEDNKKIRKEQREAEVKLYTEYKNKLAAFAKKHNGYHLTYKQDGENLEFDVEECKTNNLTDDLSEAQEGFLTWSDVFKELFNI